MIDVFLGTVYGLVFFGYDLDFGFVLIVVMVVCVCLVVACGVVLWLLNSVG